MRRGRLSLAHRGPRLSPPCGQRAVRGSRSEHKHRAACAARYAGRIDNTAAHCDVV